MNLDELELELRMLPGIRWAAFSELGDRLLVQLHAMEAPGSDLALRATRVATRHCDLPVAVEIVRWRDAPPAPGAEPAVLTNGSVEVEPGSRDVGL